MKKTYILSLLFIALAILPTSAQAQSTSIFNFKTNNKVQVAAPEPVSAPASQTTTVTDTADAEFTLEDLQNQPLHIRRRIVAEHLSDIHLRLSMLTDKTKTAAERLKDNGIATDEALTELSKATLLLAETKLSIDELTLLSNDPENDTVVALMVKDVSYKDAVINVEEMLRTARQSVITALTSLKAELGASVSVLEQ